MDSTDVYVKTPQGQDEIATRSRQLPARMRSLLIMVDGRHSVGQLLAHNPAPAEAQASLAGLLDAGLIALVSTPAAPDSTPAAASTPAADSGAVAASATASAPAAAAADIGSIKRFICTTLHDALGPDADLFTGRVEAAPDMAALLPQAEKMREVLRGTSGSRKADLFWEKLTAMMA